MIRFRRSALSAPQRAETTAVEGGGWREVMGTSEAEEGSGEVGMRPSADGGASVASSHMMTPREYMSVFES
jgi:hypothetical protein